MEVSRFTSYCAVNTLPITVPPTHDNLSIMAVFRIKWKEYELIQISKKVNRSISDKNKLVYNKVKVGWKSNHGNFINETELKTHYLRWNTNADVPDILEGIPLESN